MSVSLFRRGFGGSLSTTKSSIQWPSLRLYASYRALFSESYLVAFARYGVRPSVPSRLFPQYATSLLPYSDHDHAVRGGNVVLMTHSSRCWALISAEPRGGRSSLSTSLCVIGAGGSPVGFGLLRAFGPRCLSLLSRGWSACLNEHTKSYRYQHAPSSTCRRPRTPDATWQASCGRNAGSKTTGHRRRPVISGNR
jgi:hypothetical protein